MSELQNLLESVRGAAGPDRELDGLLAIAFPPDGEDRVPLGDVTRLQGKFWFKNQFCAGSSNANEYTASIDATLALVERVLPGTMWRVQSDPDSGDGFEAILVTGGPDLVARSDGATAPLAILAALSLPAQEPEDDEGSRQAAVDIADAVIKWMVKHNLLDPEHEYFDDDIIEVLNDLAPEEAQQPEAVITEEMVRRAQTAAAYGGVAIRPDTMRAALTAAMKEA